jgi:Ca2+/H+ antiporter
MTWYSFVFPNTALTTATFAVAKALGGNRPIQYLACAMTVCLVIVWGFVFGMMIRAVRKRQILWPQKQEDRNEGGWTEPKDEERPKSSESSAEQGGLWRTLSQRSRRSVRRGTGRDAVVVGSSRSVRSIGSR